MARMAAFVVSQSLRNAVLFKQSLFPFLFTFSPLLWGENENSFHIPSMFKDEAFDEIGEAQQQRWDHQSLLGVSVESAANYPLLADDDFLARFDLLATLVPPRIEEEETEDEKKANTLSFQVNKKKAPQTNLVPLL